ncbi:hypothetical protein BJ970_001337 [Saccharopolyspora phatthalungensis]|uniref:DUF5753 domain-containing protein n=2 Tax=Saccharopolyspora phatthalungensis TaxID=664693 RepID=A0A840QAE4_9PSEU|nr:hypothetical protein [Saccharopolyspora phatthalungensis]
MGNTGLPLQLVALLDFERRATKITDVALGLVPGLLQVPDYTRAVIGAGGLRDKDVESRVALRLGRQTVLTGKDPVSFHALIDESVLHRPVGSYSIMADQLRHIERMALRPHITVQVIPFSLGAHVGLNGSQLIMEFQRQRTMVHLEHRRGGVFLDDPNDASPFVETVARLAEAALSPAESASLVAACAATMEERDEADQDVAEVQL